MEKEIKKETNNKKQKVKDFIKKYLIGELLVIIAILVVDLVSKQLMANAKAHGNGDIVIIPHVLRFTYTENKGAAFSMLSDHMWLFIVLASLAVVGFSIFLYFKRKDSKFLTYTISVLIAGTAGNLIDRIFLGYVRDFINFNIRFAIFNIADCALTIGAILLCVYYIFLYKEKPKTQKVEIPDDVNPAQDVTKIGEVSAFHMEEEEEEEPQDLSNISVDNTPFDMEEIEKTFEKTEEKNKDE